VRHYAHFEAPIVTLKGDGYNIWADHFHPIIVRHGDCSDVSPCQLSNLSLGKATDFTYAEPFEYRGRENTFTR